MKHELNKKNKPEITLTGDMDQISSEQWNKIIEAYQTLQKAGFFVGLTKFHIVNKKKGDIDVFTHHHLEGYFYPGEIIPIDNE